MFLGLRAQRIRFYKLYQSWQQYLRPLSEEYFCPTWPRPMLKKEKKALLIICEDLCQMKRPWSYSEGMFEMIGPTTRTCYPTLMILCRLRGIKNYLEQAGINKAYESHSAKTCRAFVRGWAKKWTAVNNKWVQSYFPQQEPALLHICSASWDATAGLDSDLQHNIYEPLRQSGDSYMSKCFSRGSDWNHAGRLRKVQPVSMDLWVIQLSCRCCLSAVHSPAVLAHFNDILSQTPGPSPRPSSPDLICSYWLGREWSRAFWESPHGGHISMLNLG